MKKLKGLGKKSRALLSKVLSRTRGIITPADVMRLCKLSQPIANVYLARWTENGWLARIKRGYYIPVPLESSTADPIIEDPWIVAMKLFDPCFLSGWTAAAHWDFTEQIFQSVCVCTQKEVRKKNQELGRTRFLVKRVGAARFFGLTSVWREGVKVSMTDPTRTIIEFLHNPQTGGGIQIVEEMFCAYIQSPHSDDKQLIQYAKKMHNTAIFKRLGFLIEKNFPKKKKILTNCRQHISKKQAKLDLRVPCNLFVPKWNLWIPRGIVDDQQARDFQCCK